MTRPWRCEIGNLTTNVVQAAAALSSITRYRALNILFEYPGVWDLGVEREILRIETFSNRDGVSVTVLDLRIETFSNRDSVSILVFDLRIETFSNKEFVSIQVLDLWFMFDDL